MQIETDNAVMMGLTLFYGTWVGLTNPLSDWRIFLCALLFAVSAYQPIQAWRENIRREREVAAARTAAIALAAQKKREDEAAAASNSTLHKATHAVTRWGEALLPWVATAATAAACGVLLWKDKPLPPGVNSLLNTLDHARQ